MAGRPGYGQLDSRNPFANQSPYSQPSRQYSADSVGSDAYGTRNASTAPLAGPNGYYDQSGRQTPQCESIHSRSSISVKVAISRHYHPRIPWVLDVPIC